MPWVTKKQLEQLKESAEIIQTQLLELKDRAYLIKIERKGRENIFIFSRNNKLYQIKTMGMISDNLPEWKEKLLR